MLRLETVADRHLPHVSPHAVNEGHCYVWAWIVAAFVPQAALWSDTLRFLPWSEDGERPYAYHAFPRIGNRFFDSESPHGVLDPAELKCFKRCPRHPEKTVWELSEKHTPKSFWEYWDHYGTFSERLYTTLHHNAANPVFTKTVRSFTRKHGIKL